MTQDAETGTEWRVGRADEPGPEPDPSSTALDRERKLAWLLVAAVGVAYLVTQLVFFPARRSSGWDEAVYLSQVTPGMDALFIDAWKSRGIVVLIAPVSLLGAGLPEVRLFLSFAAAAAATAAFGIWIRLIGLAAPIAAFLFSFTWFALVGGSAVMPNLWAAILGVAVTGLVARRLEGGTLGHAVAAAVLLGAMALMRPTEATVLVGAICLYLLLLRRSSWRLGLGVGLGLLLGWLPWIVEMSIRFDGVTGALQRANSAGHVTVAPIGRNIMRYLDLTYGRKHLPPDHVPVEGIAWWSLLVILAALALVLPVRRSDRSVASLAILATVALAIEFFILVPFFAGRFLSPVYALAAVSAAIGLMCLLRNRVAARAVGVFLLVLIVPWALWQFDVGRDVLGIQLRSNEPFARAGAMLKNLAGDRPCTYVKPSIHPQLQIASGCSARVLFSEEPTHAQLQAVASGEEVFVILPRQAAKGSRLASLDPMIFRSTRKTWFIYQLSQLGR